VGDRKRAKDLSRRDQGYPYVPLDQARASWEPAPGGREAGRNLLPLVVAVIVLVVVVALLIVLLV
jgi:hypothetical protein